MLSDESRSHGIPDNPYNPHAWIVGEPSIGKGTWIGAFTLIDGTGGLKIGSGCDISTGAKIMTHTTVRRCLTERSHDKIDREPTTIGDYVFIGTNAVILMGVTIGHHSVVAAGAVVLEGTVVPPYSLVAGIPAEVRRSLADELEEWKKGASKS